MSDNNSKINTITPPLEPQHYQSASTPAHLSNWNVNDNSQTYTNPIDRFSRQFSQRGFSPAINTRYSYTTNYSTTPTKSTRQSRNKPNISIINASSIQRKQNTNGHKRTPSISMSHVMQEQSRFFDDTVPALPSDEDTDDDMYDQQQSNISNSGTPLSIQDSFAIKGTIIISPPKNTGKNKKKKKKNGKKSREEMETLWECGTCTFLNNMFMSYCELCTIKKSNNAKIIKRSIGARKVEIREHSPISPSPIGLIDVTQTPSIHPFAIADTPPNSHLSPNTLQMKEKRSNFYPSQQYSQQSQPNIARIPMESSPKISRRVSETALRSGGRSRKRNQKKRMWTCAVCTYTENPLEYPVCKLCSALPPERPPSPNPPIFQAPAPLMVTPRTIRALQTKHSVIASQKNRNTLSDEEMDPLGLGLQSRVVHKLPLKDSSPILRKSLKKKSDGIPTTDLHAHASLTSTLRPGDAAHSASKSGLDILKGVDETAEFTSTGIGGFISKGVSKIAFFSRRRAQSNEDLYASDGGSRSRSPFGRKKSDLKQESSYSSKKRNISVANMHKKQQEKIARRLGGLLTKKDLQKELETSMGKLQRKLKYHATQVMNLKDDILNCEDTHKKELTRWSQWYILELKKLASEYFDNQLALFNFQIECERLHIECFHEKLKRLQNAQKNIKKNGKRWNVDDIRNNIEVAFHTAWRIRLCQNVPEKIAYIDQLQIIVNRCKKEYELKKVTLGKSTIPIEERKEHIFLFLRSIFSKYESQIAKNAKNENSQNIENDAFSDEYFYIKYEEQEQNIFDSFVLDQRTKEGKIISRWLIFVEKKRTQITFQDLSDFMQKLSYTFLNTYSLGKRQYFECVRILCYRCILRQSFISRIIFDILNIGIYFMSKNSSSLMRMNGIIVEPAAVAGNTKNANVNYSTMIQLSKSDAQYQKKVMWMRTLSNVQLGIKDDYWMDIQDRDLLKLEPESNRRRSILGFVAGSDIPFAEAINLFGQLEIDDYIIEEYHHRVLKKKQMELKNNHQSNNNSKRNLFGRKAKAAVDFNGFMDVNVRKSKKIGENDEVIPFLFPETGLHLLACATKCIYRTCMQYYYFRFPEKRDDVDDDGIFVTQDDLFPIIIYCVLQSKLEIPFRIIHFMESILPEDKITLGQPAFALSALKAAVEYISQVKPESFGLDAEIEDF